MKRNSLKFWGRVAVLAVLVNCPVIDACQADNIKSASLESTQAGGSESRADASSKDTADDLFRWPSKIAEGPETVFYFAEAISGKKLKPKTFELLRGVTDVSLEKGKIVFHRIDKTDLALSSDTEAGAKFYDDYEKAKINLEAKFGPPGREFLESIDSVHIKGDRVEIVRKGNQDTMINLGQRKLHHAFDLRGLRFRQLSVVVDTAGAHPFLKDIEGVTAVINAPGFSFPVEVKEFAKLRLEKENDIKVGVRNPVPPAVRAILFLPGILRFHFRLSRKEQ